MHLFCIRFHWFKCLKPESTHLSLSRADPEVHYSDYGVHAAAAAARTAKDYETPPLGTTGKLEDGHSRGLAGSETRLVPQAGRQ